MECLGTLLRVVGDRPMGAYIENVDKTKMAKVQSSHLLIFNALLELAILYFLD